MSPVATSPRLEKVEQAETVRLLASLGAEVWVLGTRRPGGRRCPCCGTWVAESQGTRQTPGVADVIAFLPARARLARTGPRVGREVLFVEQKRDGGRLSPAQRHFRAVCEASTAQYLSGTLDDAIAWLTAAGYLGRR